MKISAIFSTHDHNNCQLLIIPTFTLKSKKGKKTTTQIDEQKLPLNYKLLLEKSKIKENFEGTLGQSLTLSDIDGTTVQFLGMGVLEELKVEKLRRTIAKNHKAIKDKGHQINLLFTPFEVVPHWECLAHTIIEAVQLASYSFDRHKTVAPPKEQPKEIDLSLLSDNEKVVTTLRKKIRDVTIITDSVNYCRDLINEVPNVLHSEEFARIIVNDAKKLPRTKIKLLNKAQIKKERMELFLSVNAGSHYEPRLVHLEYTPPKMTRKTKHLTLVGKGLTFDTGGYSLKQPTSLIGMKFDMGGAATVYAAFRAAALSNANLKISCLLGMTDNAVNSLATKPDSVFKSRNGKTVEILNTDAEGRLVLADLLDYACDFKPDLIIDAATLTGAIMIALGHEMAGLMSNNEKLATDLLSCAKEQDEYLWNMPIIEEFSKDIKSEVADLKNVGNSREGGASKAAAFLKEFIKHDIPWAHLDIAGVAADQSHLPYCPSKGGSGVMVRTLLDFILKQ